MESKSEPSVGKYLSRHLSQLKLTTRLLEHEVDAAKGGREITMDRHLVENILDTLDIFVEDCENVTGVGRSERKLAGEGKPTVARLN